MSNPEFEDFRDLTRKLLKISKEDLDRQRKEAELLSLWERFVKGRTYSFTSSNGAELPSVDGSALRPSPREE